mgnify:FL=1
MHHQALCALIEALLQEVSKRSLTQKLMQASLDGQSLSVHLSELNEPICFSFVENRVLVSAHLANDADCRIYLQLSTLPQLKNTENLTKLIKQEQLDVEGDLKVAQGFIAYLEGIDIDWRSEVASVIGDVTTFKLEQLVTSLKQKLSFAYDQISQDASEWMLHENRLIVTATELRLHHEAVTQCQTDVDKLAARIHSLHVKISG